MHKDSAGTYGAKRVAAELRYGRGITVGHNQVSLIMSRLGIHGLPKRKLPRGAKLAKSDSLDLVRRRFTAEGPDRLWMTDITEHPTREGKVLLLRRAGRVLPDGCGLIDRQLSDRTVGHERPRDGHPAQKPRRRSDHT